MNKKGFTIIELIVVIAIIAVLASIVAVNVVSYINKSKDAAIKANMDVLAVNASAFYDRATTDTPVGGGGTYTGLAADNAVKATVSAINTANGLTETVLVPSSAASAWCMKATLKADTTNSPWCVDSTGYKGKGTNCSGTTYTCQ